MSDIIENIHQIGNGFKRVCRVAYTINNYQPVTSTIIDEQPLFYMDYEADIEEEELLDAADLNILESEIEQLQKEIEAMDRFDQAMDQTTQNAVEEFLDNTDSFCGENAQKDDPFTLKAITDVLSKSRIAQAYLEIAAEHGVSLSLAGKVEDALYDRKAGKIFINSNLSHEDQILLAARELRRHWQHRQGALINPLMFHPDNAVLVNRAQVADLTVAMVRIAWELQLSGEKAAWDRIEHSSMGDLARAYAREAYMDFRTINNGLASAAVFETWFLSERCRNEDKKLIKQMLADYQGYVFDLEEAETSITPTLIAALGEMPFGKNYLAVHADVIMSDPIFTDVRDRSNANFLWFIKFERSFRETERDLQDEFSGSATGVRQVAYQDEENRGITHEAKEKGTATNAKGDVVTLYEDGQDGHTQDAHHESDGKKLSAKKRGKKSSGKTQNTSAEIVYLRRWSGE